MKRLVDIITALQKAAAEFMRRPDLQYLFITAIVLRLIYLAFMLGQVTPPELMEMTPDSVRYIGLGQELLNWRIMDEAAVLIFGPGYGAFLGTVFFLFGVNALSVILVQIILSGLSCLMIYRLGRELSGSRAVGLTAGYLSAMSFTSISLANIILSDTLFFFLFLCGNLLFLLGLKIKRRSYFVWSGIAIGLAILTRSIGQFWPVIMVGMIFLLPTRMKGKWWRLRLNRLKIAWVAPVIALILVSIWMGRNYHHHDTIMLATTSTGGPANVAAWAAAEKENASIEQIRNAWQEKFCGDSGTGGLDLVTAYDIQRQAVRSIWAKYPGKMIEIYFGIVYENVTAVNELYRLQCPAYLIPIMDGMYWYRGHYFHFITFWGGIIGLAILAIRRKWWALLFLGAIFFYFAVFMGFTRWQGSRLFFPAQIAWAIFMAYIPYALVGFFRGLFASRRGDS